MATGILSILVPPIVELGKCLFDPLKRQICYIIKYKENLDNLENQANDLVAKRNGVKNLLDAARRRLEEPIDEVQLWLRKADDLEADVRRLTDEASENKRCFKGLCPDWSSRRRLSKQAVKKSSVVNELQETAGRFSVVPVSHPPPPRSVESFPSDGVEDFASRNSIMDQVMGALRDEHIRSIGVHGMGGVGKTTLVKKLNNDLQGSQLFEKVIMVNVSNNPDFRRIQYEISERLGLKLEPESTLDIRANRLSERLKNEKTVLIILDDVWEKLEVANIGIPNGTEHKDCKVILTTREQDVCRQMGIQTVIKMELLSEDESWNLFKSKAGDVVTRPMLLPIAQKIARKCKGSPLAIVTFGLSLRGLEDEFEWRNALRALENPEPMELEGVMPEVFSSLRFSYDHLKGPEDIKLCFLFCCLFPEDYNINLRHLRDYGIGEGFLKVVGGNLVDATNKLLSYVRRLKASCLLLDGSDKGFVKMHDVVREVAISIASKEYGFLVKAGIRLGEWPEMEWLDTYKRISLMGNKDVKLSSPLESPQLLSLLLGKSRELQINSDNFFEGIKALVVLDLSYTRLTSVPQSFLYLTNLRTLYLEGCDLSTNISILGGLKNLEILGLSDSKIGKLPEEIGNLINLKSLDLTKADVSTVSPNVISRLSKLEELCMLNSFNGWDMEGSVDESNASFAEVASLYHLATLEIVVTNERCMSQDIPFPWKSLNRFCVIATDDSDHIFDYNRFVNNCHRINTKPDHILCLHGTISLTQWAKVLINSTEELVLESCHSFNSVVDLDTAGSFSCLEHLRVRECDAMEEVFNAERLLEGNHAMLVCLREIELRHLPELRSIWKGFVPFGSLQNLKKLKVRECRGLKYLFSSSMAEGLQQLEELIIDCCEGMVKILEEEEEQLAMRSESHKIFQNLRLLHISGSNKLKNLFSLSLARCLQKLEKLELWNCEEMVEIIAKEEEQEVVDQGLLPQLRHLDLGFLNGLTSICQDSLHLNSPLEYIAVVGCPNLKRLPIRPVKIYGASKPMKFHGAIGWFEGLEWEDNNLKSYLQPLLIQDSTRTSLMPMQKVRMMLLRRRRERNRLKQISVGAGASASSC